jgi:hypothetical protein
MTRKGCVVDGVDQCAASDASAFRRFWQWREPDPFRVDLTGYDCVLLLDVIEHLTEPERVLDELRAAANSLTVRPQLIVTTGNVAFCVVRLQMLLGNFNYGRRGILDMTHTRLYTFKTLAHLFQQCGYRVERLEGVAAPIPLALGNTRFARALVKLNAALIRLSRGLFAYQVFLVATPLPTVDALLDDSIEASASKKSALRAQSIA